MPKSVAEELTPNTPLPLAVTTCSFAVGLVVPIPTLVALSKIWLQTAVVPFDLITVLAVVHPTGPAGPVAPTAPGTP